jgi:hypothetical protein
VLSLCVIILRYTSTKLVTVWIIRDLRGGGDLNNFRVTFSCVRAVSLSLGVCWWLFRKYGIRFIIKIIDFTWKSLIWKPVTLVVKNYPPLSNPNIPLPHVHKFNNGPRFEPHKCNQYNHVIFKVYFNIIQPSTSTGFREIRINVTQ